MKRKIESEDEAVQAESKIPKTASVDDETKTDEAVHKDNDYVSSSEEEEPLQDGEALKEAIQVEEPSSEEINSFSDLGLHSDLVKICNTRGWSKPSPIQAAAIPPALKGRDVIGLAVTGSGKTGAFVLPILNSMLTTRAHPFYAVVVTPTRELAIQISEQFNALGCLFQLSIVTLTGGLMNNQQVKMLAKNPHIIVATPGRLVDHLTNTQGFNLNRLKFLVLDEADRLLTMDFEEALRQIVKACPTSRQTFLFSATMTSRVSKLQKLSLHAPVKVSVDDKTQTAKNLKQFMALVPQAEKFAWTATMLKKLAAYRTIVFCNTCKVANILNAFLRRLGFASTALSGDMHQAFRMTAIKRFKSNESKILVTTEVGSRGLDLPQVNYVINFDVPTNYKDYIHRVGRTARAGAHGQSYTIVNQHDVADLARIETKLGLRMEPYTDINPSDYQLINFAEAKNAAEKEYQEAQKKNVFKKKQKKL